MAAQFTVALMLRAKLPAKLQATRLPAVHGAVASAGWRGRVQRKRTRLGVALVAMPAAPTMVNLRLQDVRYPTVQLRVYQRASGFEGRAIKAGLSRLKADEYHPWYQGESA